MTFAQLLLAFSIVLCIVCWGMLGVILYFYNSTVSPQNKVGFWRGLGLLFKTTIVGLFPVLNLVLFFVLTLFLFRFALHTGTRRK